MEAIERMQKFLDEIKENPNSLGKILGFRDGTSIYYIISGRNGISKKLAKKIKDHYPWVSVDWLVMGSGEMHEQDSTSASYSQKLRSLIPNKILDDSIVDMTIPEKGEFTYVMKGNAMIPDLIPGDILECLVVNKNAPLEYGRKYLINMENGPIIRKIMPNTSRKESITLISNDEIKFPAITINLADIEELAIVSSYMRRE